MTYISVVMPARNAERTIAASVRSVLAHPEVGELIVVDDGSSDQTAAVAARLDDGRVRVVSGLAQGISAAMNTGVAASKYTLIARCDADDLLNKERFLFQLPWIIEQPDYVGISGGFQTMTAKGGWIADLAVEASRGKSQVFCGTVRCLPVFVHGCFGNLPGNKLVEPGDGSIRLKISICRSGSPLSAGFGTTLCQYINISSTISRLPILVSLRFLSFMTRQQGVLPPKGQNGVQTILMMAPPPSLPSSALELLERIKLVIMLPAN